MTDRTLKRRPSQPLVGRPFHFSLFFRHSLTLEHRLTWTLQCGLGWLGTPGVSLKYGDYNVNHHAQFRSTLPTPPHSLTASLPWLMYTRLVFNLLRLFSNSCPHLPSARIIGMGYYAQLSSVFNDC